MSYLYRTDNPIADFDRYDREQSRLTALLPKCTKCKHPVEQEYAVCIDGEWYCDECLEELRKYVERSDET